MYFDYLLPFVHARTHQGCLKDSPVAEDFFFNVISAALNIARH